MSTSRFPQEPDLATVDTVKQRLTELGISYPATQESRFWIQIASVEQAERLGVYSFSGHPLPQSDNFTYFTQIGSIFVVVQGDVQGQQQDLPEIFIFYPDDETMSTRVLSPSIGFRRAYHFFRTLGKNINHFEFIQEIIAHLGPNVESLEYELAEEFFSGIVFPRSSCFDNDRAAVEAGISAYIATQPQSHTNVRESYIETYEPSPGVVAKRTVLGKESTGVPTGAPESTVAETNKRDIWLRNFFDDLRRDLKVSSWPNDLIRFLYKLRKCQNIQQLRAELHRITGTRYSLSLDWLRQGEQTFIDFCAFFWEKLGIPGGFFAENQSTEPLENLLAIARKKHDAEAALDSLEAGEADTSEG